MCDSTYTTGHGEKLVCQAISHAFIQTPHYSYTTDGYSALYHWSDGMADTE